jgi:peptidoglycan/LPS O-acetylase OafA/YrhL
MVTVLHQMGDKPYWYSTPYSHGPYHDGEEVQHNTSWIQLPFIRAIYHFGHMIPIFFVISGYVLSFRSIQFIRGPPPEGNKSTKLAVTLFWSAFRRTFRLFVPSMVGLWYNQVLSMLGIGRVYNYGGPDFMGYVKDYLKFLSLLFGTVWHFDGPRTDALHQFWTIPVEYSCSLGLFVVILLTSWMPAKLRMLSIVILIWICASTSHHGFMGFFSGMLLADMEESYVESEKRDAGHVQTGNDIEIEALLERHSDKEELDGYDHAQKIQSSRFSRIPRFHKARKAADKVTWILVFIASAYVMGWPWYSHERDPIILWLDRHIGGSTSVYAASFAFVACGFRFKWLQNVFTCRFALYLGDISYSIYIVHLSLLFWNKYIVGWIGIAFGPGRKGHINRFIANMSEICLCLVLVVWVADMFWRAVDIPSIKLARRIEQKVRRR